MAQTQQALDILQSAKRFNNEANRILHNAALHLLNQEHGLTSSPMHSVLHCESRWMLGDQNDDDESDDRNYISSLFAQQEVR